jgi:hypothetical protein
MSDLFKAQACIELRPDYGVSIEDGVIVWSENATDIPTDAEINAKATELENAYNNKQYQRDRQQAYASLAEQLDMQYWDRVNGTSTWKEHIDAVKAAHPKPTE